ncbi:MAG: type II toxin-antitoxin system prevent-host-death family antitoxin [Spirochaetales bacterium]|nr:type II toxin-antitoxin system prevent-host-death family antitoxin [Spirochaetales bacterium]
MPNIKPVSDLRNYYDVLSEVREGAPVFLTKNGRGAYAIITLKEYEEYKQLEALFSSRKKDRVEVYLSEEEVKQKLGVFSSDNQNL